MAIDGQPDPASPGASLRRKLTLVALASSELHRDLAVAAAQIKKVATLDATEATVAGKFEREMYAVLRQAGIAFDPEKEGRVDSTRHTGHGRLDSRLGAVVIEYKRPAKFNTQQHVDSAAEQLEGYLVSITEAERSHAVGFLTDGRQCVQIRAHDGVIVSRSPVSPLTGDELLWLTRNIHALDLTALNAANLIRDFCGAAGDGALLSAARTFRQVLAQSSTPKTGMLRSEWEEVFRLGHNDKSQQRKIADRRSALSELFGAPLTSASAEYEALFALHTAYALVVKFMAYRIVSEIRLGRTLTEWGEQMSAPSEPLRIFCAKLENGDIFRSRGILNLLEGDFFSWYADRSQWNDAVSDAVRSLLVVLGQYEQASDLFTSAGAVDLFRELYEATVPQAVRSSMGEFYTPHWLAQHVLHVAKPRGAWRALDPCSGSGTFVIAAIERLRDESSVRGTELLDSILDRVAGIDLNPLAVLTTRVNYFIQIADLLPDTPHRFVIPVFLGDASNVPTIRDVGGVPCVEYTLRTLREPIDVILPLSTLTDMAAFVEAMLQFENSVKKQKPEHAVSVLRALVPTDERVPEVEAAITSLATQLVALEAKGWNGIWARILTNFLATAAVGRFDCIIGNPPWIDWKNLPEGYRQKVKSLCLDRGLFSGDGRTGGINLNICALISHVSAETWLKKAGRLAFLMPKELLVQQSYQGWRNLSGSTPRGLKLLVDWTGAGHPFEPVKEDFMTYVVGPGAQRRVVPVIRYRKLKGQRQKARDWRNLSEAKTKLKAERGVAGQVIPGSTAFTYASRRSELDKFRLVAGHCAYIGREGIEFYPQELQLFRYEGPGPGTVFVRNIQKARSKFRIPAMSHEVETKYLHPLIKGPSIRPFAYDDPQLIVAFPYDASDPHRPISADQLELESPRLLGYYEDYRGVITAQNEFSDTIRGSNPGEFYGLARTGPYSFADTYVAFRDNTAWQACVVSSKVMPWGETRRYVFQNHAASMCERPGGGFIDEQEAHFVCAILNTPAVRSFILSSSDHRSFKVRPPVFVPPFDSADLRHRRLAELSTAAHAAPGNAGTLLGEMETIYLELCALR
jgi:hypothetical protein